jgi:hypothetical protein
MCVHAIEPESSKVTKMFGSTDWFRSGGVAPRSGGEFGATGAAANALAACNISTAKRACGKKTSESFAMVHGHACINWMGRLPRK